MRVHNLNNKQMTNSISQLHDLMETIENSTPQEQDYSELYYTIDGLIRDIECVETDFDNQEDIDASLQEYLAQAEQIIKSV